MADQKPPRRPGADEREVLRTLTQYHRESILRKLEGLSDEDARWSPVASGTSLLWLVKHLCFAERLWVKQRYAGLDAEPVAESTIVAEAVAAYRRTWDEVDAIVAASSLDDQAAAPGPDGPVNLRWIVAHLLEETARHAGHADILRELLDGDTGR